MLLMTRAEAEGSEASKEKLLELCIVSLHMLSKLKFVLIVCLLMKRQTAIKKNFLEFMNTNSLEIVKDLLNLV
jgi:hypothetical protein